MHYSRLSPPLKFINIGPSLARELSKLEDLAKSPSSLLNELKIVPSIAMTDRYDEEDDELDLGDLYQYEEGIPEEESGKIGDSMMQSIIEYELLCEDEEMPGDTDEEDDSIPQLKAESSR
eukprot:TRINITY_DN6944_c0_g1_i1.p2 TRINITY_DN6944_c0_g1~~TRINITY_DN6944_c0_g1_i1.p2  ORF type:complete len:120 (-),score=31.15 TRINITY_DN6944_c0_g1_i1:118-477(-)